MRLKSHVDVYPSYAFSEKLADGIVHLVGILGALGAIAAFVTLQAGTISSLHMSALSVYWIGLVAMFCASGAYHLTPWEHLRPRLRRLDHAMIYVKIAGTYTPFVVVIGTSYSYGVLGFVWVLAAVGAGMKLFMWRRPHRLFGPAVYLGLGWISVLLIREIFSISDLAGWLCVSGGLLYTLGVVFFNWESLKYANAIWHGFVLIASGCFFAAVTVSALSV